MAFDIEMIKAVYARLEERVSKARTLTGNHSLLPRKFCIHICGMEVQVKSSIEELIM